MRSGSPRALIAAALAMLLAGSAAAPASAADVTGPVPSAPGAVLRITARLTSAGVPVRISWRATDPSGIARYQLQLAIDGGSFVTVPLARSTSTGAIVRVPAPHWGQVRVRATDGAGNTGPWVPGAAFRVRRVSEAATGTSRTGAWATVSSSGFGGGTALRASTAGPRLSYTFTGAQVAWIGRRAAGGGDAEVWADGVQRGLVLLDNPRVQDGRLLWVTTWPAAGSHTLEVRAQGGKVWMDGFVVLDAPPVDPVLVGAGDIATCGVPGDNRTARLLDAIAGRVFTAGDAAYPSGSTAQFRDCYGPTWGRWRLRTSPVPGNHEYRTAGAAGYFSYFGKRAGERGKGWYAYDLGAWRVYNLNANCSRVGCGAGSEQVRWLEADLAAHPRACVAAVWHQPLFSSGQHGGTAAVRTLWEVLDAAGADIVLNGHDHDYERFAAQDAAGRPDPDGMVEFVVGTGGSSLRPFGAIAANSVVRDHSTHGVLKLTLRAGGYDFAFVPVAGSAFRDAGSGECR